MALSKIQTEKTKFNINFSTFKMAKVQIFAICKNNAKNYGNNM